MAALTPPCLVLRLPMMLSLRRTDFGVLVVASGVTTDSEVVEEVIIDSHDGV